MKNKNKNGRSTMNGVEFVITLVVRSTKLESIRLAGREQILERFGAIAHDRDLDQQYNLAHESCPLRIANDACLRMLGYSASDVAAGLSWAALTPP